MRQIEKLIKIHKQEGLLSGIINRLVPMFWISNKEIRYLQKQQKGFRKLYKKYISVLNEYESYNQIKELEKIPTYPNRVWICWLQGIDNAPPLVKSCITSVEKNLPHHEIILLDTSNIFEYIDFPDYILQKWDKGIISNAQFTDLIRLELLVRYGGLWIDSTVYVTESDKNFITNNYNTKLFMYSNYMRREPSILFSSWLIYSNGDSEILKQTRYLMLNYWENENRVINYFIFHFFITMACENNIDEFNQIYIISNINPHLLQSILLEDYDEDKFNEYSSQSIFHKLNYKIKDEHDRNIRTTLDFILRGNK